MDRERWSLVVRRPEPNEYFPSSKLTEIPVLGAKWIAEITSYSSLVAIVPASSEKRAIKKAKKWIERKERAEESGKEIEL